MGKVWEQSWGNFSAHKFSFSEKNLRIDPVSTSDVVMGKLSVEEQEESLRAEADMRNALQKVFESELD